MKIQLLSDTHSFDYDFNDDADVVVHAGDFCNNLGGCLEFDKACREVGKIPIFVPGNHDYYGSDYYNSIRFFKDNPQYNCLYPGRTIEVGEYTFVGGTLFTNFRKTSTGKRQFKLNKQFAESCVRDFSAITTNNGKQYITADDMLNVYNETMDFLETFRGKDKTIVVTHFPPSLVCQDPYWSNHPTASHLNPYFINNIDLDGFKLWLSGHTHTAVDSEADGCKLYINPFGYPNEQGKNGFRNRLLIDLKDVFDA